MHALSLNTPLQTQQLLSKNLCVSGGKRQKIVCDFVGKREKLIDYLGVAFVIISP